MSTSDISEYTSLNKDNKANLNNNLFKSDLNVNDLYIIVQSAHASLVRKKIYVEEMQNIGLLYNRISSHIRYIELSNKDELEQSEKDILPNLNSKLEQSDLIIFMDFIKVMTERELFNDDEKEIIETLKKKIDNVIKTINKDATK